jgi:hypothetical protein
MCRESNAVKCEILDRAGIVRLIMEPVRQNGNRAVAAAHK